MADKQAKRLGESSILTLAKVERKQAGVYQCTADNNVGDPVTVDMRLDVLCKYTKKNYCLFLLGYFSVAYMIKRSIKLNLFKKKTKF